MTRAPRTVACPLPGRRRGRGYPRAAPAAPAPPRTPLPAGRLPRVSRLIKNPAYKGAATFGRTRVGERRSRLRPMRGKPEHPRNAKSRYKGATDDQITIPALHLRQGNAAIERLFDNGASSS
jgi:hypothetical protein